MTKRENEQLVELLNGDPWKLRTALQDFLRTAEITEQDPTLRTEPQHNGLFLWFGMIEKEAEKRGITWDMIIRHTHQLRVTKENLHSMCKDLQRALWKTDSTKKLKKQGQLDIIIDHLTDLFAKEGLELPPFPHEKKKGADRLEGTKIDIRNDTEYPDEDLNPTF